MWLACPPRLHVGDKFSEATVTKEASSGYSLTHKSKQYRINLPIFLQITKQNYVFLFFLTIYRSTYEEFLNSPHVFLRKKNNYITEKLWLTKKNMGASRNSPACERIMQRQQLMKVFGIGCMNQMRITPNRLH